LVGGGARVTDAVENRRGSVVFSGAVPLAEAWPRSRATGTRPTCSTSA